MRVVLFIVILFCLVQGGSADAAAVSIMHQIYAALYYMMALIAFCTLALMGPVKGFCCNWDWHGAKGDKEKPHGPKHHHGPHHAEKAEESIIPEEYEELAELAQEDEELPQAPRPHGPKSKARIRIRK